MYKIQINFRDVNSIKFQQKKKIYTPSAYKIHTRDMKISNRRYTYEYIFQFVMLLCYIMFVNFETSINSDIQSTIFNFFLFLFMSNLFILYYNNI